MKVSASRLLPLVVLGFLSACSSVKMVEGDTQGGIVKYHKSAGEKDRDANRTAALAKAEQHCKRHGFTTYKVQDELMDGEEQVVKFQCRKQ